MLVSAISDEFSSTVYVQADATRSVGYNYSWSFLLALLSFLGCEVSALLSFSAYMEKFGCQQDFVMIIPGMERKITEVQLRLSRDTSTVLSTSTRLVVPEMTATPPPLSPVPVDLLKCSFVHCPSPDSSMDTLISRQGHSQYSFGQGVQAGDDSFHNLTAVSNDVICSHTNKTSEDYNDSKNVTFSHSDSFNNITMPAITTNHHQPYSNGTLPGSSRTGLVNCLRSSSGHHVILSTGHDSDNKPYSMTMSRISNNIYTKYDTNREEASSRLEMDQTEMATFPRQKKKVTIVSNCESDLPCQV